MKFGLLALCVATLMGCSSQNENSELVGKWREDKTLTLASMNRSKLVAQQDFIVMNNPSFGNAIKEFTRNKERLLVVDSGEDWDLVNPFRSYKLLEVTEDYFLIHAYSPFSNYSYDQKLYREGNCFYEYNRVKDYGVYYCKTGGR